MLTELKRVMVAVSNDAARTFVADNLQADGYEPIAACCLGHASSRLSDRVDALIVDLNADTTNLIDMIRGGEDAPTRGCQSSPAPRAKLSFVRCDCSSVALTT